MCRNFKRGTLVLAKPWNPQFESQNLCEFHMYDYSIK